MAVIDIATDEASRWMENTLDGANHPALNTEIEGITFDERRRVFTLVDTNDHTLDLVKIYADAEKQKRAFIETVEKYNAVAKTGAVDGVDIRTKHTWDEIIVIQRRLNQEYESKSTTGVKGFLHKQGRRFGEHSESFQSWLELLPSESLYASVLCGGLILVLGAASRMNEIRESIQRVMEEIPSTFSTTNIYLDLFGNSPEIHKCSADLYVAILGTLDNIVQELNKSLARRVTSAFFKQSNSSKELSANINRINTCGTRLANQAKICSMQQQRQIRNGQIQMAGWLSATADDQDQKMNEVLHNQKLAAQRNEALLKVLNEFLGHLKASPLPLRESIFPQVGGWALLPPTVDFSRAQSLTPPPTISRTDSNRQQLNEILTVLSYDRETDIPSEDAAVLLDLIYRLGYDSQDRAVCLINSLKLQEWVTNTTSSSLLVNGNINKEENLRQSALSFVCAKLVTSILPHSEDKDTIVLRWFCGQHTNMIDYGPGETDYDAHPSGMINNLLAQFITQLLDQPLHLDINMAHLPTLSETPRSSELCNLFSALMAALPPGTILFCIIDGISHYEDFDRRADCLEVLSMLQKLVRNLENTGTTTCLFKLLVTAPTRSHIVQDLFDLEDTLTLEEYIPASEGFTALHWDLGIGRTIEG